MESISSFLIHAFEYIKEFFIEVLQRNVGCWVNIHNHLFQEDIDGQLYVWELVVS